MVAVFDSSSVTWPVKPGSMNPAVECVSSPAESPYGAGATGSRYQGQRGPTASRSAQNFHRSQV